MFSPLPPHTSWVRWPIPHTSSRGFPVVLLPLPSFPFHKRDHVPAKRYLHCTSPADAETNPGSARCPVSCWYCRKVDEGSGWSISYHSLLKHLPAIPTEPSEGHHPARL